MCPHEEKLTAWLLGDLSPEAQKAVARHLTACAACRATHDELAAVLTPLQGGLAKDRRLAVPPPAAKPPRQWAAAFLHAPWLRAAALLLVSFGALFTLLSLYYQQATTRKEPVGPVTTITFHKREQPPEPLNPLAPPADETIAQPLVFDANVPLPQIAAVIVPDIPLREISLPSFLPLSQLALWAPPASNTPPAIYNQLVAQQPLPAAETNATDGIPFLQPAPPVNAYPPIRK
ncbi:MAG: zf-HC2 domain-containing protein [Kiritimatiellaeota bacterium]|nr:zf-HC2 domain-containing protein [Kiritimatiellota bacterium]